MKARVPRIVTQFRKHGARIGLSMAACLALSERVYGQAKDPWDAAVQVLQTAFTGPIATGLALVAIVVGGLMFAFGEGAAKRVALFVTLPAARYSSDFSAKLLP